MNDISPVLCVPVGELAGKVALVTGDSSGIGLAAAQAFLAAGASVALCGRSAERDVARLVASVLARFGRLDHAFNNAANTEAATSEGGFTTMALSEFEGVVRASLTSVWLCMKHELPALLDPAHADSNAGGGGPGGHTIVNTSSMDAKLRTPGTGVYAAAKSGVEALTVAAAKEYALKACASTRFAPEPSAPPCWRGTSPRAPKQIVRPARPATGHSSR